MFKSLLQTIPTISGNFTLACKLNNYEHNNDFEYTSYINDAILMPLDNNYNLTRDIKINLINGKYEYDVNKYFKEMFAYFYNDTYLKNSNIFETYPEDYLSLPDNRDKNFEFGCKRISYHKYQYQYQFFAPIYINNIDDLPDEFVIEIFNNNSIVKQIHIPINKSVAKNKLRIYLNKFIEKLHNNTPVIWNFVDNKIIYNNVIDCKNGGLISLSTYNTIQNNNIYQTIINDIDNLICQNYEQNKIILSECIPLSFIFNIDDLLEVNDSYYYHFNEFNIQGYYIKNNSKCKYYTFSTNYHNNYQSYSSFDNFTGALMHKEYNIFDNDIIYSLKEGTNDKLYYQNTFKQRYFQWKLLESESYIINLNSVFTYNSIQNKFPVFKNVLLTLPKALYTSNTLYIPIHNYVNIFSQQDINQYNILLNNNYTNWFNIFYDNYDEYIHNNYKNELYKVYNNYVFINGIKYYVNDNKIKYFGIYINPIIEPYQDNIIVGDVILEKKYDNNNFVYYDYIEESNNFYKPVEISEEEYYNAPDTEIYIQFDQQIQYFEHFENIVNELYNNDDLHNIYDYDFVNLISLKQSIKQIYNLDDTQSDFDDQLNNIYLRKFNTIFDNYFKHINGYQKLDISLNDFTEDNIYQIFKSNKSLIDTIYYSLPNIKTKNNLYYDLINQRIDYQYLINNNVTLFIKKIFVEFNNKNKFLNSLFGDNGLFTQLYKTYYKISGEFTNYDKIINSLIENLSIYLNKTNYNQNISLDWITSPNIFNRIFSYQMINDIDMILTSGDSSYIAKLTGLLNNLLDIIIYITLYINVNIYCNNSNNITLYKYIPYYNDNNIIINYDYFEKLYNKRDYEYLYTNIKPDISNANDLKKTIYVHIDNIDMLKYYINNNLIDYNNVYQKKQTLNMQTLENDYQFIDIQTYIDENINYISTKNFNKQFAYLNDDLEKDIEYFDISIEDILKKYICESSNKKLQINTLYFLYNKHYNSDGEIMDESSENLDPYIIQTENDNIELDLYIKISNVYLLTDNINTYIQKIQNYIQDSIEGIANSDDDYLKYNPIIIYKEYPINLVNDSSIILTSVIYNDESINKCQNFKYQQLCQNINEIRNNSINIYTYKNPYNYLVKTTIKDYYENYKIQDIPTYSYYKLNNVNDLDIKYVDEYIDDYGYAYILVNYHLILSTNLFNIYNVDNNDNFEIVNVNDIQINDDNIKDIFKKIYPYFKQDILINLITKINNQINIDFSNIKIILPNNIKCNINTIVNKKTDNENFTNILLTNDIIQILYLNRYFGNIDPYFKEITDNIYYSRSKIYINDNVTQYLTCNNNNVYIENLNIYNYNSIPYYVYENNKCILKFINQTEYKHFNNNYWFNLPTQLEFAPTDIDYINKNELSKYVNKEKCFEYFVNYLEKNFINFKSAKNKNLFLYIFNKYSIEYIQYKEQQKVLKNTYKITYKLTLL